MANILLGITGSVAAIRTPELFARLVELGHSVQVAATSTAFYFVSPDAFPRDALHRDEDEWPRREKGQLYHRGDPVLHIDLRRWADLLLIAPLDANTLAKLAVGLADNLLTCIWRAWDSSNPVVLAPAMNTLMWQHPLTGWHLRQLIEMAGTKAPADASLDQLIHMLNAAPRKIWMIPPTEKQLACGDIGVGALAEIEDVVAVVRELLPDRTPA